ncbi:bifunctional methylenetetrahydrofolate dehydrogenase/methenyltetrahydrofolate cyclohydrolase FolD [Papillibacter cinnamivorans]|uniref:Bifunctional protein FolD n=1 Tax=Papillibacter cinnamivorans DSM 12816 TaxID=1122930 RepID=A0A1W1ZB91_9FIRM|nr:bifunctional methylenetetrahydrofolate dehydrogenase/methenyltetrahydrofolate cyclohydrolase FolD [Papillibacter cinnamivorans]SMC45685.1 methylenetetrahydrofolate dehydrogenase (NADP+) / methenyltetrahydrofolate cyclohydrolase [Papillibacter cinnamivorans DSM 12816]
MAAVILDGKALAKKRKTEIASRVAGMKQKPGLAVIIVGNNPASRTYVDNKKRDCAECGILSREYALPEDTGEEELLGLISELNRDGDIDGILVQLPLPEAISEDRILTAIDPQKDVDAFHPYNVGLILTGKPVFLPCTPAGVMAILDEYKIPVEGKRCVVVGRSNIVGKPQALLLLQRNGTVTVCHSRTADLPSVTREADILVSAVGKRGVITGDMVKPGAVVIDVAMNRNEAGKLCGDCAFEEVSVKASYITPVPGGVGPMTRVMLLENTLKAAGLHQKL